MNERHTQQTTKGLLCVSFVYILSFVLVLLRSSTSNLKACDCMTITEDQLEAWIRQLIKENKLEKFYKWREWRELSEQIKKEIIMNVSCAKAWHSYTSKKCSSCAVGTEAPAACYVKDVHIQRERVCQSYSIM